MNRCLAFSFLVLTASTWAQPFVFQRGVVNAASFVPPGLPGGAIAQGSIFSIFGRNLGPATPAGAAFPLSATLGGVAVEVCTGAPPANCIAALPLFVSAGQINAVMPSNAPIGRVSLRVRNGSVNGNWSPIDVAQASAGIFTVNSGGFGPGIVQNYVSATELPLNSLAATAKPGQTLIVYATGLGPSSAPDNLPAPGGSLATSVEVFLGENAVRPDYAGRAPGFAGLDQINIVVPSDVPIGCYVPLRLRTNGRAVSNTVTIAIHTSGGRCGDVHNPISGPLSLGQKVFGFLAHRVESSADIDPYDITSYTSEWATANSIQARASDFHYSMFSLPPRGTCTVLALRGSPLSGRFALPYAAEPAIELGTSFRISAGGRNVDVPRSEGLLQYFSQVSLALSNAASLLFGSGNLTLSGNGGSPSGSVATEQPLTWLNRSGTRIVNRAQALTVQWSGGRSTEETVIIAGLAEDVPINAAGGFLCAADPALGTFTVPPHVLANLPISRRRLWEFPALLLLGRVPARATSLNATGFDFAAGGFAAWQSNTVRVEGGN